MAFRRRTFRRRRPRARRPRALSTRWSRWGGANRRIVTRRMPRGMNIGIHHFKRTWIANDTLPINSSGNYYKGYYFTFASTPGVSEFTTLFDQYRMNKIVVKFIPNFTGSDLNPGTSALTLPNVHTVIDYDSATDPASIDELLHYGTYRLHKCARSFTLVWTPACEVDLGGVAGAGLKFKQWVDMAQTGIRFYGLRVAIEAAGGTVASAKYTPYVTYYFSCKGTR